jgi:hypothetical protein
MSPVQSPTVNAVWEKVAVYCENHTEHTNTRTSKETHYVSTTEPNCLMLLGEKVAVYCENHMEHTNTRTSKETHYVSTTEPNRLMLLGEKVAVYCEKHQVKVKVVLRPTVSRPVYLVLRHSSGTRDQFSPSLFNNFF